MYTRSGGAADRRIVEERILAHLQFVNETKKPLAVRPIPKEAACGMPCKTGRNPTYRRIGCNGGQAPVE